MRKRRRNGSALMTLIKQEEETNRMRKHLQTEAEWQQEMAEKILDHISCEIYVDLRFFKIALSALEPREQEGLLAMATNGTYLYYESGKLMELFRKNERFLQRAYLHTVLHCIFFHLWTRGKRDRRLWNLACDIVCEYTIDYMDKPCTRRILSYTREQVYGRLKEEKIPISAQAIYGWLLHQEEIDLLYQEFYTDDHTFWPKEEEGQSAREQKQSQDAKKNWEKISRQTRLEKQRSKGEDSEGDSFMLQQLKASRSKRSYESFLRQFSVLREELRMDPDEFDMTFYTYGLQVYGKMPLIEPLETKETYKIRDFVIALDTSYSVSGELVQRFLEETFTILTEKDSFFYRNRIHIIQCDDMVRMDEEVHSLSEIESMLARFTMVGGGNTDFRPVFAYVDELIQEGKLKNMCGLLYFTDGKGIYPSKCPKYKSAFLYLEDYDEARVPAWAITMKLEPEELGQNVIRR